MNLKIKTQATDGWMDKEGNFYSCWQNRLIAEDDAWLRLSTNLHQVLAKAILAEFFPDADPNMKDEWGLSGVQNYLVSQGWIRVDIETISFKNMDVNEITSGQITTLKQMLAMPDNNNGFARKHTQEVLDSISASKSKQPKGKAQRESNGQKHTHHL